MQILNKMMMMGKGTHSTLTLTGAVHSVSSGTNPTTASFKWDNDGNVYRKRNADAYIQISTATDWLRPTSGAPDDYEIRFTNLTGDTGAFSINATVDVWQALTTDLVATVTDTDSGIGGFSCSFDIEIRKGSTGSALASASYTLSADYDIT